MSTWSQYEGAMEGKFLRFQPDEPRTQLKFVSVDHRPATPQDKFPGDDGKVWEFLFEDKEGNEKVFNQMNAVFARALQTAEVEPGDVVDITKKKDGQRNVWEVVKSEPF